MMMQQLHDGENDDVEPMRDVPALVEQAQAAIRERVVRCAACGEHGHPATQYMQASSIHDGYMIYDPTEGKCKVRRDVLFDQRWR